jgi:group I intron endonuclease
MLYILYKTSNKINGKIYIGVHKTEDINDGYLGSGKGILDALKKYNKNDFAREVLYTFESEEEMYKKEAEIVDIEFIKRADTYNQALGGDLGGTTGWSNWNNAPIDIRFSKNTRKKISDACSGELNGFYGKKHSKKTKDYLSLVRKGTRTGAGNSFYGKKHTEETKKKISENGWEGEKGRLRRARIKEAMTKSQCVNCDFYGRPKEIKEHLKTCPN